MAFIFSITLCGSTETCLSLCRYDTTEKKSRGCSVQLHLATEQLQVYMYFIISSDSLTCSIHLAYVFIQRAVKGSALGGINSELCI